MASQAAEKSALHLILGGAAVYRCGKSFALNSALAAESRCSTERDFFRSLFGPYCPIAAKRAGFIL
jgi:hypothetical protein